jgi:undecaprenyl-phosphate galactose phosphotransferase
MTIILTEKKIKSKYWLIKRCFDFIFSLGVITIGAPFFILIGLIIYLNSPGPIFYTHARIGKQGKMFKLIKFRTMHINADKHLISLLQNNPSLQEEWNKYYKLKDDPRVFPFGKFLRKTSLDELPQFFNVLKGDMSVVGPRPIVEEELIKYVKQEQTQLLSVKPGITGLWQISGRSNLGWTERIKLEKAYIYHSSFTYDMWIILKTIQVILTSKGAY